MRPYSLLAKPTGPRCNIACSYCYYLEKEALYPDERKFRMQDALLRRYVGQQIAAHRSLGQHEVGFYWQGGEPTMLGLDWFRRLVALQAELCPADMVIQNALQTNAMLIDEEWAAFLAEAGFLVGVSIDGPRALHDRYRRGRAGQPSFDTALAGLRRLQAAGVAMNLLATVNRATALRPVEVYRFLAGLGVPWLQFIPIIERRMPDGSLAPPPQSGRDAGARLSEWSVPAAAYGRFLCAIFDQWYRHDTGRISVQHFDVQVGLWAGYPSTLCIHAETCGQALAMEHNGEVFVCDHYVYPEYRLGNLATDGLEQLVEDPRLLAFGQAKADSLPKQCRSCRFRFACNGGCPKHRFGVTRDGEPGLNHLCEANRMFLTHAGPRLRDLALRFGA
jgi:uncharacterized protein